MLRTIYKLTQLHNNGCGFDVINKKQQTSSIQYPDENETTLKKCARQLVFLREQQQDLHNEYQTALHEIDLDSAGNLDRKLKDLNLKIQNLNGEIPVLTHQDLDNMESFFTAPADEFFLHDTTSAWYECGDHTLLLQTLLETFFQTGYYKSWGVRLQKTLPHPVTGENWSCDFLYCVKKDAQIAYEMPSESWLKQKATHFFPQGCSWAAQQLNAKTIEIIRHQQEELLPQMNQYVQNNLADWNYETFKWYESADFIQLNYPKEEAYCMHAIALFHKKSNL